MEKNTENQIAMFHYRSFLTAKLYQKFRFMKILLSIYGQISNTYALSSPS